MRRGRKLGSVVSRKSDNEMWSSVKYKATFQQLSAEYIRAWVLRLDSETEE